MPVLRTLFGAPFIKVKDNAVEKNVNWAYKASIPKQDLEFWGEIHQHYNSTIWHFSIEKLYY